MVFRLIGNDEILFFCFSSTFFHFRLIGNKQILDFRLIGNKGKILFRIRRNSVHIVLKIFDYIYFLMFERVPPFQIFNFFLNYILYLFFGTFDTLRLDTSDEGQIFKRFEKLKQEQRPKPNL